ncbi:MAG: hypothetical protein JO257_30735, partial [Deltaproteobacteria bacterium]|nr:hypothetical protein [Deltaproteobacteria bacterium]
MRHVVLVVLAGCSFSAKPAGSTHDAPVAGEGGPVIVDAPPDTAGSASCTTHAVPPSLNVDPTTWRASFLTAPVWSCTAAGTTTIDSTAGTVTSTSCPLGTLAVTNNVTQSGGGNAMVVRLRGLTISGGHTLRIIGDKPIVLLVAGNVSVDAGGMIDASANGNTPGPGGSPASCVDTASGLGAVGTANNWGGGGGGFGTAGGVGEYQLANGGAATGDPSLVPLRGGCGGGLGTTTFGVTPHAGGGGGAIEIDASGTI